MADYMVDQSTGPLAVRYRPIVMWIHWITAILLIVQVYLGFTFHDMPRGPARAEMFTWHKTVGATILILALLRLAVRLMNPPPPYPSDQPEWKRFIAVWNHRLFYVALIALPLTGLTATSDRAENGLVPLQFGLALPAVPRVSEATGDAFGEVHEFLVWTTLALLVLHISAALYNQFIDRGPVSDRMWPFKSSRRSGSG